MNKNEDLSGEMELSIIDAATRVFVRKGKAGASMQDIADEAGINRTLLNYYFRSKDKLFHQVFKRILDKLIREASQTLNSEKDIFEKVNEFIDVYMRNLSENPLIPVFVMSELSSDQGYLLEFLKENEINPSTLFLELEEAMDKGRIIRTNPAQLILNLVSMVIFPFAAKNLISGILSIEEEESFEYLMQERKLFLKEYIINSIKL